MTGIFSTRDRQDTYRKIKTFQYQMAAWQHSIQITKTILNSQSIIYYCSEITGSYLSLSNRGISELYK